MPYACPFTIGEHIAFYTHLGFNLIPLEPARQGDKETGKRPAVFGPSRLDWGIYQHRMSTTPERLSWWPHRDEQVPNGFAGGHNMGIVTGRISNLIVLDIDDEDSYAEVTKGIPSLLDDFTVKSGRGYHIYLRPDTADVISTTTFKLNGHTHHVKAEGGYVVAPPSMHYSGAPYALMVDSEALDNGLYVAPRLRTRDVSKIAQALVEAGAEVGGVRTEGPKNPEGWVAELLSRDTLDGERHETLKRLAGYLAYVFGPYREHDAMAFLKLWNETRVKPRMYDRELEQMMDWAMGRERQEPRHQ